MRVQAEGALTRVDYRCAPRYGLGDPRACVRQIMVLQADVAAAVADYQALADRLASSRAIKRRDS